MTTSNLSGQQAHSTLSSERYSHIEDEDVDKGSIASTSHSYLSAPNGRTSQMRNRPIRHQTIKDGYTPGPFGQTPRRSKTKPILLPSANETQTSQTLNACEGKGGFWKENPTLLWEWFSIQTINGFLLLLPLLYFSRVTAIFKEVHCSGDTLRNAVKENFKRNHQVLNQNRDPQTPASNHLYWAISECPEEVEHLKNLWDNFINAVTKEWETMNLVAILLVGTIIASMQIGPIFADEIIRYLAFGALVCGLMSLVFSCTYMIRFSIMRPIHKAVEWAKEGEEAQTHPFWNVWIFLSIPAIWLSWSLILFVAEIFAFLWLCDSPDSAKTLRPSIRLAAKVAISVILGIGIIYLILILSTLKRYGARMDDTWKKSIDEELKTGNGEPKTPYETFQKSDINRTVFLSIPPVTPASVQRVQSLEPSSAETLSVNQSPNYLAVPTNHFSEHDILSRSPEPILPDGDEQVIETFEPVMAAKLFLGSGYIERSAALPAEICERLGGSKVWTDFVQKIIGIWGNGLPHQAWMRLPDVLRLWNQNRFRPQQMEAVLVWDIGLPPSHDQHYMIYVVDLSSSSDHSRHFLDLPNEVLKREIIEDTGVVKLRLILPRNAECSDIDRARGSRPGTERKRSKTFSSDGGTISVLPPSPPASRTHTFDTDYSSTTEAFNDLSRNPAILGVAASSVAEVMQEVEKEPNVTHPEILNPPPRAIQAPRSRSLKSKSVRYIDEIPGPLTLPPIMTPIQEAPRTAAELASRRSSGPGISPLLRRHLSHRFLHDHNSLIEETYSVDERASPATSTATPNLVISHKHIPHKIYVKNEPSITINNLLSELANQLHQPVPDDYLRGLEPGVVSRLRMAAEQRARADGKRGQDPITETICTVDLIWGEKTSIHGFVERPDGTWELETQEN